MWIQSLIQNKLFTKACTTLDFPPSLSQELTAIGIGDYVCYKDIDLVELINTKMNDVNQLFDLSISRCSNFGTVTCASNLTGIYQGAKFDIIMSESYVDYSDLQNPVKQRLIREELFIDFFDFAYYFYKFVHNTYTFLNKTKLEFYR